MVILWMLILVNTLLTYLLIVILKEQVGAVYSIYIVIYPPSYLEHTTSLYQGATWVFGRPLLGVGF